MRTDKIARYIISFLLREEELPGKLTNAVGYTDNLAEMSRYKVVIKPSGFFDVGVYGTDAADPKLPLLEWEGVPLLFGTPCVTRAYAGGPILIHADIVASTYYLVVRFDVGVGLHTPYDASKDGFFNILYGKDRFAFHFAIGYPF